MYTCRRKKRRKLDAKAEKCILVGCLDEQKGYVNVITPRVSRDVVFDESASWYLPSPPTPMHSIPNSEDDVSEAEMPTRSDEIGALRESPISFWLSGPNEGLSRNG